MPLPPNPKVVGFQDLRRRVGVGTLRPPENSVETQVVGPGFLLGLNDPTNERFGHWRKAKTARQLRRPTEELVSWEDLRLCGGIDSRANHENTQQNDT